MIDGSDQIDPEKRVFEGCIAGEVRRRMLNYVVESLFGNSLPE